MNLWHSGSISVVGSLLDTRILMKMKGYPRSNLAHWSKLGRLGLFFLHWRRWNRGDGAPPWPAARWAQAHPMVHYLRWGFFLRDLCDERNPIYSLVVEKTGHRRPVATVQVGRPSTTVRAPSGGATAPRCTLAVAEQAGAPPPSDKSTREALTRWINGDGWLGGGGSVLGQIRTG
jgi:hypothetical protein